VGVLSEFALRQIVQKGGKTTGRITKNTMPTFRKHEETKGVLIAIKHVRPNPGVGGEGRKVRVGMEE